MSLCGSAIALRTRGIGGACTRTLHFLMCNVYCACETSVHCIHDHSMNTYEHVVPTPYTTANKYAETRTEDQLWDDRIMSKRFSSMKKKMHNMEEKRFHRRIDMQRSAVNSMSEEMKYVYMRGCGYMRANADVCLCR